MLPTRLFSARVSGMASMAQKTLGGYLRQCPLEADLVRIGECEIGTTCGLT
jgi:hypothetical protein